MFTQFNFIFDLFDDTANILHAGSGLNTVTTSASGLTAEMKTFYDRVLLRSAEPELVHEQFGQTRTIPANNGKTIEFRKFGSLGKALTPLTEGVTPDGQDYSVSAITATIAQYGGYISTSDMLNLTTFDNNQAEIMRMLGSQMGKTKDTLVRDVIAAGTNVIYAGGKTRKTMTNSDKFSIALVKQAVRKLKRQNAPKIGDSYVAIVHPDTVYDLWNDPEWVEAQKYNNAEKIYNGEIGMMFGVRFVESTEAKFWGSSDTTTGDATVYGTIVLGKDAFGVIKLNGGGAETIVKQLGSGGTADPLNQRATMGWKMTTVTKILDDTRMVRIEHGCSLGGDTASN